MTVPAWSLRLVAPLTRLVPGVPTVRRAEVQRLQEDKSWGIEPMRRSLGVVPIGLAEGLGRMFAGTGG